MGRRSVPHIPKFGEFDDKVERHESYSVIFQTAKQARQARKIGPVHDDHGLGDHEGLHRQPACPTSPPKEVVDHHHGEPGGKHDGTMLEVDATAGTGDLQHEDTRLGSHHVGRWDCVWGHHEIDESLPSEKTSCGSQVSAPLMHARISRARHQAFILRKALLTKAGGHYRGVSMVRPGAKISQATVTTTSSHDMKQAANLGTTGAAGGSPPKTKRNQPSLYAHGGAEAEEKRRAWNVVEEDDSGTTPNMTLPADGNGRNGLRPQANQKLDSDYHAAATTTSQLATETSAVFEKKRQDALDAKGALWMNHLSSSVRVTACHEEAKAAAAAAWEAAPAAAAVTPAVDHGHDSAGADVTRGIQKGSGTQEQRGKRRPHKVIHFFARNFFKQ